MCYIEIPNNALLLLGLLKSRFKKSEMQIWRTFPPSLRHCRWGGSFWKQVTFFFWSTDKECFHSDVKSTLGGVGGLHVIMIYHSKADDSFLPVVITHFTGEFVIQNVLKCCFQIFFFCRYRHQNHTTNFWCKALEHLCILGNLVPM